MDTNWRNMTTSTSSNLYSQSFGTTTINGLITATRNPSPTDVKGPYGSLQIGQKWINTLDNIEYTLTSFSSSEGVTTANWTTGGFSNSIPFFSANLTTQLDNVTGDEGIFEFVLDNLYYSQGTGYDLATGLFTAPQAGIYQFSLSCYLANLVSNNTRLSLSMNEFATGITYPLYDINPFALATSANELQISGMVQLYSFAGGLWQARLSVQGNSSENVSIYGLSADFSTSYSVKLIG